MAFSSPSLHNFQNRFRSGLLAGCWLAGFAITLGLNAGEGGGTLSSIAEREVARRQALLNTAAEQLSKGIQLTEEGKYEQATNLLLDAYRSIPESPLAQELRNATREAFATAACAHARELLQQARYQEAHQVLDVVLSPDVCPKYADAVLLKKQAGDPDRYPPAQTPDNIAKAKQINELLTYASSAAELGDHDKALNAYTKVLQLDAYNTAARRGMEKVEQKKGQYYDAAYDHTRSQMLNAVNKQWETTVPLATDVTSSLLAGRTANGSSLLGRRERLEQKLRTLKMAKVDFAGASLDEVVEFLRITSRNVDPEGRGVDFIIKAPPETKARTMTLNLSELPLEEVVRYVVEMAGAAYRVEDGAVVITSLTDKSTALISKTYRVPPDFIQATDAGAGGGAAAPADPFAAQPAGGANAGGIQIRRMGAKEFLEARGVTFGPDASATFSAATSTLVVRNTAENIALIDTLVEQAVNNAPKQVVISAKIIEVSQEVLTDIHNQIALGQGNVPGSERVFFTGGSPSPALGGLNSTTEGLRSTGAILGAPGINQLLSLSKGQEVPSIDSQSPAAVSLFGALTDPQFNVLVHALNEKTGKDLVTAPSVVARSGQKASVHVVREFPYPTEFDPPEIPQSFSSSTSSATTSINGILTSGAISSSSGSGPIVPTTPTTFEVKEIGTILEVEPVISEDGRTVDLVITPSNTEFEGFVDYGSDIQASSLGTSTFTFGLQGSQFTNTSVPYTVDNPIVQPVFRKSGVTTSVTVWDGNTVVLGGVLREEVADIQDKVPVVGDIPLIGRLWQSKVKQTIKKCVLMFVNVKVIDPGGQPVNVPRQDDAATHQALMNAGGR